MVKRYIDAREAYLTNHGIESPYYVFKNSNGGLLTDKTIRQIRNIVEEDTGVDFDGRMCRRTFCKCLVDKKAPVDMVSRCMGHGSTKTTEKYYGRIESDISAKGVADAVRNAFGDWTEDA